MLSAGSEQPLVTHVVVEGERQRGMGCSIRGREGGPAGRPIADELGVASLPRHRQRPEYHYRLAASSDHGPNGVANGGANVAGSRLSPIGEAIEAEVADHPGRRHNVLAVPGRAVSA